MRNATANAVSVDDILTGLDAVREPAQRLPLLLAAVDGISGVDARRALGHAREAAAVATELADQVAHAEALFRQGRCWELLQDHATALDLFEKALEAFKAAGESIGIARTLNMLGAAQDMLGDAGPAECTLQDALALSESIAYVQGIAQAHLALGRLYAKQAHEDMARERLHAALQICEQQNIRLTRYECHEALAEFHERLGDPATALHHFRRFHQLEKEVQQESASVRLRDFAIQFQVAAAKRDAELQRERQAVLTLANAELDALNVSLTEANLQKTMLLDQLERQTFEDALTGLANRRRLDLRLADEFARAHRHGRPLAVAIADLDNFKLVNDRHSHAVGDAALRSLARLLSSQVRHTDLVARFGGEEFVLVLLESDAATALGVCEKLRALVEQHAWDAIHPGLALTLSIGVCADTSLPGHERMLAAADRNLYLAKAGGRNRVVG